MRGMDPSWLVVVLAVCLAAVLVWSATWMLAHS
jgi:hypothetical protein